MISIGICGGQVCILTKKWCSTQALALISWRWSLLSRISRMSTFRPFFFASTSASVLLLPCFTASSFCFRASASVLLLPCFSFRASASVLQLLCFCHASRPWILDHNILFDKIRVVRKEGCWIFVGHKVIGGAIWLPNLPKNWKMLDSTPPPKIFRPLNNTPRKNRPNRHWMPHSPHVFEPYHSVLLGPF